MTEQSYSVLVNALFKVNFQCCIELKKGTRSCAGEVVAQGTLGLEVVALGFES